MPLMGRKKAPNWMALSFSRNVRSVRAGLALSSFTSPKNPRVRCICSGAVQRTPRIFGSRSTSTFLVDSGRSIATKRRLLTLLINHEEHEGHEGSSKFLFVDLRVLRGESQPSQSDAATMLFDFANLGARSRFIAGCANAARQAFIHQLHNASGQVWEKRIRNY